MNKLNFTKLVLSVMVVLMPFFASAQNEDKVSAFNEQIYATGSIGVNALNGENTKMKIGMNGYLGLGYQFDKYVGIKANIGYGGFNGEFEGMSFDKQNFIETNLSLTFDLTHIVFGYNPERRLGIVPHIGIGQLQYRTILVNNNGDELYNSADGDGDSGIGDRKIVGTVPMGLELNYLVSPRWKLYLDFNANFADSDRLDGLIGDFKNDWLYSVNLGTAYRLTNDNFTGSLTNLFKSTEEYCNYWYVTLDGGASFLNSDGKTNFSVLSGSANVGVGYNFHDYYRLYGKIGLGGHKGHNDTWEITEGEYLNASINFSADLLGLITGNQERLFTIYPHIGIGQTQFRTSVDIDNYGGFQIGYDNEETYNRPGSGINSRRVVLTFPLGMEFVYNLNENAELYADASYYITRTDMLDCINAGSNNDAYTTCNIGLRYKFNRVCIAPEEDAFTPEAIKEALKEAIDEEKAQEPQTPASSYITPEDLKQAIKDAIEEYEASKPQQNNNVLSPATVVNNNYSDISFPKNGAQKVKTQTNIDALNRASNQVNDGSAVNRVIIEGYASPEGDNEFNERLAQQRAEQAAEIIKKELGEIDAERIEITNKGADWDGLISAIAASDIENAEDIIEEIKNSSNKEETLQELLKQYPQIRNLLPQLRRASVVITTVK